MPKPDYEFWSKLERLKFLNSRLTEILKFTDHPGIPLDLNHPQGKSEIEAFKHFATKLEDNALEFSEHAETITTYTAIMEEILSQQDNESLPAEGDPGYPAGA